MSKLDYPTILAKAKSKEGELWSYHLSSELIKDINDALYLATPASILSASGDDIKSVASVFTDDQKVIDEVPYAIWVGEHYAYIPAYVVYLCKDVDKTYPNRAFKEVISTLVSSGKYDNYVFYAPSKTNNSRKISLYDIVVNLMQIKNVVTDKSQPNIVDGGYEVYCKEMDEIVYLSPAQYEVVQSTRGGWSLKRDKIVNRNGDAIWSATANLKQGVPPFDWRFKI